MKRTRNPATLIGLALLLGGALATAPSSGAIPHHTTSGAAFAGASPPPPLVGHWTFDEGSGTTAADSSGHNHPLALRGGAGFGTGPVGAHDFALNGSDQYAASEGTVIDTGTSFTVSAWVNLANLDGYQTFVSVDGDQVSGFYLQLRGDSHRFAFTRLAFDSTAALGYVATSPVIPQPGVWYHVAGVYDAARKSVAVYVDGLLGQRLGYEPSWSAAGVLAVGRGRYGGNPVDFCAAGIDDVRAYAGALGDADVAALAGGGRLSVAADQSGPAVNPTQFGAFLEEINHSGDGGLYAELVRNRDLKENASTPAYWSALTSGGASASISLDTTQPLNPANPVALRLSIADSGAGGRAGVANAGYWGIPVRAGTAYQASFYAKASAGFTGPLSVTLESTGGTVWARATVVSIGATWARYQATLVVPRGVPETVTNRLVISAAGTGAAGASIWFDLVSLFPPTYDNTPNGLRVDLMRKLAAMRPGFFRVPGGNYLEGNTIDTRFAWKTTVGPVADRPGHLDSAWGYWSQDGLGLLEYLELAEEVGASPMLAVYAGYSLNGSVVPADQLGPYVSDALDEIEYAIGGTDTTWGAKRAADGHPAPFDVRYVEIGNEDQFDRGGSYPSRYAAFYDAIKARYPQLKLVATTRVTSRPMDVLDDHYYNGDPAFFAGDAHVYDTASRTGPKILVGEYAATQGVPTGTLGAALGEAAFMTGLVRNADVVIGASYAPLLVNVNAPNWSTNLIGYDAARSYGSPSYYVQRLFGTSMGDHVAPTQLVAGNGSLYAVATRTADRLYLIVVNRGGTASPMTITLNGLPNGARGGTATVLAGDPAAMNSLDAPQTVAPRDTRLGALPSGFRYTFAANSVTVLALDTTA